MEEWFHTPGEPSVGPLPGMPDTSHVDLPLGLRTPPMSINNSDSEETTVCIVLNKYI